MLISASATVSPHCVAVSGNAYHTLGDTGMPAMAELLARYQPGDCLLVSPSGTRLGQGVTCVFAPGPSGADVTRESAAHYLKTQVQAMLHEASTVHGVREPVVMGVVPFDIRRPARLVVPQQCHRGACAKPSDSRTAASKSVAQSIVPYPEASVYEAAVVQALQYFERAEIDKVVLARTLDVILAAAPDRRALLDRLVQSNLNGYTYAIALQSASEAAAQGLAQPAAFIGATPELLVRRVGTRVIVNPLAGSAARRTDSHSDALAGQQLLDSAKDRHEHAVVIDAVAQALRPLCRTLNVPDAPSLLTTDALWHLSTVLTGELSRPETTSLDLALALHPTPAVCGYPVDAAFTVLQKLEPFDRGFFAGFVGWCDANGDGEWAVSLRCAQLRDHSLRLFAGAGIVAGSNPCSESQETGTKFRTMLSALGLSTSMD